jgi:DNA-binding transcriptional LysR family regulator
MNLRALDLNLLPVFEAIYIERSLTRASEALHVTQPAVSNALARLRSVFGDPLFVRSGRGMTPTPAAESLIGPVRESLARLKSGLDRGRPFDAESTDRVFNVSLRDMAASAIAPNLAQRLERAAPGVRFYFHQIDRASIPSELAAGRLDFAIDIAALSRPELQYAPFMVDRYVCALRRGHRLARRRFGVEQIVELGHVAVSSRKAGRNVVDLVLGRLGHRLRPVMRFPHFAPAFHVVMSTDLALIAPLSLAQRYDVCIRRLPFEAMLELMLYWRRDNDQENDIAWARECLLEAAATSR